MSSLLKTVATANDHHLGSLHALVVIVEYGDFECPHCGVFSQVMEQLLSEFKSNICFVYRHFPIENVHPNAVFAALAAEAADQQSEFWNMYSLLSQNYDRLSPQLINECASDLGLDMKLFRKDLERQDLLERINRDINSGDRNDVQATPGLFINGHFFEGPATYNELREKIERLIEEGQLTYI